MRPKREPGDVRLLLGSALASTDQGDERHRCLTKAVVDAPAVLADRKSDSNTGGSPRSPTSGCAEATHVTDAYEQP